jgi:hypothetical protein
VRYETKIGAFSLIQLFPTPQVRSSLAAVAANDAKNPFAPSLDRASALLFPGAESIEARECYVRRTLAKFTVLSLSFHSGLHQEFMCLIPKDLDAKSIILWLSTSWPAWLEQEEELFI